MRFWLSLLISSNVHVWAVVLYSLGFPFSVPSPKQPEPIEVRLLTLPALPQPGQAGQPTKHARFAERRTIQRQTARKGPSVEYKVTVSSISPADHKPSESQRIKRQQCPKNDSGREFAHPVPLKKSARALVASGRATAMLAPASGVARQHVTLPGGAASGYQTGSDTSIDLDPGGDPRPLVEIIQARIDEVTPLIHHISGRCRHELGAIRIALRLSRHGYEADRRILTTQGAACLKEVAGKILHMAEPYPYVAGWIPITIRFTVD